MVTENSISIPKAQLDPDTRRIEEYKPKKWPKPVSYILSALTALSIAYGTKKSSAENTNINIPNTQLGEFITKSNIENGVILLERLKQANNVNNDSFFILRIPIKIGGNIDKWANDNSMKRADYYTITPPNAHNLVPQLLMNGKCIDIFENTKASIEWDKLIKFTKENPKQMGKFSIKETERNKKIEIEFLTEDKKLKNNSDYNFTVIAYQNWVNVDAENGERTYENIFIESPLGATGLNTKIDKNGMAQREAKFVRITEENRKQSGFVVLMQNKNTKEIIATGLCRFAELDGIRKAAYFNWNNNPKEFTIENYKEYEKAIGLQEMKLTVNDAVDIKTIIFEIDKSKIDEKYIDVLAGKLNPKLKDAKLTFNPKNQQISIELQQPINGNIEICTLFTHMQKENLTESPGFQIRNISIKNSNGEIVYFDFNDMKPYGLVQPLIGQNKHDLDSDTWVGPKDEQVIMDEFGKMKGDKDWMSETEKCDLNKDGRIDAADLAEFELVKDGRVDNYKRAKIVFETNPGSLPTEIQDEIEKDLKKLQTEALRAQIDQAYQQLKAE